MKQEVISLEITPSIFFHIIITLKKEVFISDNISANTNVSVIGQYQSIISMKQYIGQALLFNHSLTWTKLNRQLCLYVPLKHSGWCDCYACSYVHVVCADKTYRSMCLCVCMPVSYKYVLLPWHISACIRNILKWHCKTNTVEQLL